MIVHSYTDASDNLAQYEADQIGRQEVTIDWYLDNMIDACLFRWTSDEDALMGLDPWRFHMDLPIDPDEAKERGWRIFVQRTDMPLSDAPIRPEMTEAEQEDAAYWNHVSKIAP